MYFKVGRLFPVGMKRSGKDNYGGEVPEKFVVFVATSSGQRRRKIGHSGAIRISKSTSGLFLKVA